MKPVASELSGIAVEPDPTTVKGFASVTGTYLLGLAVFGVLRSSDGLAKVIVGPAIAFRAVGRTPDVDRPEPICTGSDMADLFSLMVDIWSLDMDVPLVTMV